ncbi:Anti-sigma F factor [Pelotomaculum schinkii]|uniref:Anti-sigma F factor n=1 Tax=Pelotomaculum schinkii TaxID=78350 RepID=A0A4Y7RCG3_9FIRM|nr:MULTISPECIES: anti-sigma F factor [Pelotomaculum]TEB06705.1 Anti-sigma F factor [Pelotomaculum schinkii]TEB17487.1 Anti-sigma F factor [Pelotomaculum sp. FP]
MPLNNQMKLEFLSIPANISFARATVAAFASQLEFTLSDLEEVKVAVSEAVSNSIIHGYRNAPDRFIKIYAGLTENTLELSIEDDGRGIEDIDRALQPAFTTDPERLGLGFVFMQSFMENLQVDSLPGRGTMVRMSRRVGAGAVQNSREH